jgi:hypothetical protein
MRDTNQGPRPFPRRSPAQTHATILGHNIFHIHPRIGGHLPRGKIPEIVPFFAADFSPMKDFAPFENDAPFTKSNCPPDPLYGCPLINVRVHLPVQVHLDRRVHAHHVIFAAYRSLGVWCPMNGSSPLT